MIATTERHALAILPATPTREQIEHLEALLFAAAAEHGEADVTTEHHHVDGLYGRSIVIPAGTVLTGAPHKADHLNVCVGDITVWTEDGMKRLTGVHILPSRPGAKRVGYAHADTLWLTVHANRTGSTEIAELEQELIEAPEKLATRRALIANTTMKAIA